MYIDSIKLKNFRNYVNLDIQFSKSFNIIYGYNGQGKTNILEAIFMCATGRSHRTSRDVDLVKFDKDNFYINLKINKNINEKIIEVFLKRDDKKKIRINEIPLRKVGDLMGNLNAVIFSPEDLQIIKEGPSQRRRFLDMAISQIKPSYFHDLQQYARILAQRNSLLKDIQKKRSLIDTLQIWNYNLSDIGSRIMKTRNEFINRLAAFAENNHYSLTESSEKLLIKYNPSIKVKNFNDLEEIRNIFNKVLDENKEKEIIKSNTLFGPQRDDIEFFINDSNLKLYGSQGQQRTVVLSLKISEVAIMEEETGEFPVLLLDDVMSELDIKRQKYLFVNLKNIQTFITCTDRSFFDEMVGEGAEFFNIFGGNVVTYINRTKQLTSKMKRFITLANA